MMQSRALCVVVAALPCAAASFVVPGHGKVQRLSNENAPRVPFALGESTPHGLNTFVMSEAAVNYDPLAMTMAKEAPAAPTMPEEARIHAEADTFFATIDTNGDGVISCDELRAHLGTVGYGEEAVGSIFALLDGDDNGEISQAELRHAFVRYDDPALRLALGLGTTEADAIFSKIDINGDGQISKGELTAFMTAGGFPLERGLADSIFNTLDTNRDGAVSREELRTGYVRYSALRDALGLGLGTRRASNYAANSPKGAPKRWGRGSKLGDALVSPPSAEAARALLTDSQRRRLQPVHDLERQRNTPRLR